MPKRIPWRDRSLHVEAEVADDILSGMKSHDATHSQTMPCTMCPYTQHTVRYCLLECRSSACLDDSLQKCEWRGKTVTCLDSDVTSIYEYGEHTSPTDSPPQEKTHVNEKAILPRDGKPSPSPDANSTCPIAEIRHPLDDLSTLMTVLNSVNSYSRTYIENHDRVDEIQVWVHANAFTGNEPLSRAFTFGWEYDHEKKLNIGNGSDTKLFIVGLSTKALVKRMEVPPESFALHMDGAYKTNQCDYPVLVVGLSDCSRRFHLVALFVISQETQPMFEACLPALRRLYQWVTHKLLVVQYAMVDADQAQYNSLSSVFSSNPKYQFLMCFFTF
ncbi:hypothetical protein PHMEG_0009834 [Phytophthora megakarya]|uniref:MULE transposase domain-containing protein n=1 Tax=Phytophthora megakarya TaxID=4795 RepID=A0A225WGX1_9STRA|nr:hypothetical protein PHMEG_0009834 [Phytophthora megakarya]